MKYIIFILIILVSCETTEADEDLEAISLDEFHPVFQTSKSTYLATGNNIDTLIFGDTLSGYLFIDDSQFDFLGDEEQSC